jgi:hypothetical protein
MSRKSGLVAILLALSFPLWANAGVKVAGVEFVPKDLIFAAAEAKSHATADGSLPNECKWNFSSETRIAKREESQSCVRYYFKTTVTLEQSCPAPNDKITTISRSSERITATGPHCPDSSGKVAPAPTEAKVLSSGTNAEGKHQDILTQPDGSRITLLYDNAGVSTVVVYPDGTADALRLP